MTQEESNSLGCLPLFFINSQFKFSPGAGGWVKWLPEMPLHLFPVMAFQSLQEMQVEWKEHSPPVVVLPDSPWNVLLVYWITLGWCLSSLCLDFTICKWRLEVVVICLIILQSRKRNYYIRANYCNAAMPRAPKLLPKCCLLEVVEHIWPMDQHDLPANWEHIPLLAWFSAVKCAPAKLLW